MLCVGVTGHRVLRYCFTCKVFWVLSWQWFWMCFMFKLEEQVSWLTCLKWGGFIQSVDGLMRTKSEENSSCLVTIRLRHWLFSYLYIWIEIINFLCLRSTGLWIGMTPIGLPGSSTSPLTIQILEFTRHHNYEQFFITDNPIGSVSLENPA